MSSLRLTSTRSNRPLFNCCKRIVGVIRLDDFAVEIARQIAADRRMIRPTLADVEDSLGHGTLL